MKVIKVGSIMQINTGVILNMGSTYIAVDIVGEDQIYAHSIDSEFIMDIKDKEQLEYIKNNKDKEYMFIRKNKILIETSIKVSEGGL